MKRRDPIVLPDAAPVEIVAKRAPGRLGDLIRAALLTGCRQDELASAKVEQFDEARAQLTVIGKGNKRRTIDLTPAALAAIRPTPTDTVYLFTSSKGSRYNGVAAHFHELCHGAEGDAAAWDAGALAICARPVHGIFRWPRWAPILVALALAVFAIVAIRSFREPVLRAAGWALVVNDDPVARADIIVLSLDSGGAGALEAADLVQSGISKRVAVFMDPPTGEDHEFIRRGLPYEDAGARQIRQLRSLGVTDVVQISRIDGTEGEGQVLPPWCDEQHLQSIVAVATKDHS